MPKVIVIRAPGTNCDQEMCRAFALARAEVDLVHVDRLIASPGLLDHADLLAFPGGFSYGDDIASGRVFAMKLRERLWPRLRDAAARGVPMIGACNGFQIIVQLGLLPSPLATNAAPTQELALADNLGGRFVDRWVGIDYVPGSACIWTREILSHLPEEIRRDASMLPVAHGEGRLVGASPATITRLGDSGQVPARYMDNFNGSSDAIAGVCDPTGRIFALMPHPERYLDWTRHPYWTRLPQEILKLPTPGMRMFQNAVDAASPVAAL
jgi:phosphoribosylformylglycinamidine synthase